MRKGQLKGGKVATPIREMLDSPVYNGVVFHCEDERHAETVRFDALVLKWRCEYDIHTAKRGSNLIVYKDGWEYEPENTDVVIFRDTDYHC